MRNLACICSQFSCLLESSCAYCLYQKRLCFEIFCRTWPTSAPLFWRSHQPRLCFVLSWDFYVVKNSIDCIISSSHDSQCCSCEQHVLAFVPFQMMCTDRFPSEDVLPNTVFMATVKRFMNYRSNCSCVTSKLLIGCIFSRLLLNIMLIGYRWKPGWLIKTYWQNCSVQYSPQED